MSDTPLSAENQNDKYTIKKDMAYLPIILIDFHLAVALIAISFAKINSLAKIIILIVIGIILVFLNILILYKKSKEIVILKNIKNKQFEFKILNLLNKPISYFYVNIKGLNIYTLIHKMKRKGKTLKEYGLAIVNTYNDEETDLDTSNIRNIPKTIFHLLKEIEEENKNKICDFMEISPEPENPAFLNIEQYMGKPYEKELKYVFGDYSISKYMKINDHFFCFYFNEIEEDACCIMAINTIVIIIGIIGNFILIPLEVKKFILIISIILTILLIFIINFIYCHKEKKRVQIRISRINIIFSKNFDRIFIGLVNYKEELYLNTFMYDINSVERFILEPIDKKWNYLKVVLKTQEVINLCQIDDNETTLEGLLYILNERLSKSNSNNYNFNQNENLLVKNWD